jgi:hypothetical protein
VSVFLVLPQSSFVAYFDESGDHGLQNIDREFPVFVLCACVFKIRNYIRQELGTFSRIKFKHFGHDAVIFHSRDIRKRVGPFQILMNAEKRDALLSDISTFFQDSSCTIIAAGIDKNRHVAQYALPVDPYSISLLFCLERLNGFLRDHGEAGRTLYCVFECRGDAEDRQLAVTFERICAGQNRWGELPFRMVFADKKTNMPGLQIADLAAYPIARHILTPRKRNQSYDVIEPCFRRSPTGQVRGWGLKVFP